MAVTSDGEVVEERGGHVSIAAPGPFGSRWGGMTPVGLIIGHVVYGVVAALVYGALV